ncbi:MAG: hypothetical protein U0984_07390 [Prosthecobacter sp.]|nr:hypothetical protein [Prosthecobacter sp.]
MNVICLLMLLNLNGAVVAPLIAHLDFRQVSAAKTSSTIFRLGDD